MKEIAHIFSEYFFKKMLELCLSKYPQNKRKYEGYLLKKFCFLNEHIKLVENN